MHVAVRRYRRVEGDRDLLTEKIRSGFVPLISEIDGFVDYYCFYADDGSLISVSVYRDRRGAEESVRAASQFVAEHIAQHLPEKPEVLSGDVFAHGSTPRQQ